MKDETRKTGWGATGWVIILVASVIAVLAGLMLFNPPAKAIPDRINQFQLWHFDGQYTTTQSDIVANPGVGRCAVIDVVNASVLTAGSSSSFEIRSNSTVDTEYFVIPGGAVGGWNWFFQRKAGRENEGLDLVAEGSLGEIFVSIEGHYEPVY